MQVLTVEGRAQRTHLIEKHAYAPDVSLVVISVALHDFWAQVVRSADDGSCHFSGGLKHSGDAEVAQFYESTIHKENVSGFDVTVEDLSVVAVLQCEANLSEPVQDLVLSKVVLRHLRLSFVASLQILNLQSHVAA